MLDRYVIAVPDAGTACMQQLSTVVGLMSAGPRPIADDDLAHAAIANRTR